MSGIFVTNRYINLRKDLKNIEAQYFHEHTLMVKKNVDELIEYIDYRQSQGGMALKEELKNRVETAYSIAMSSYRWGKKNNKSNSEIKQVIIENLRPLRFLDNRGQYFIADINGKPVLSPSSEFSPSLPGFYSIDTQKKLTLNQFFDFVNKNEEGFSSYFEYKLENDKHNLKKIISYFKLFKSLGWIIGAGDKQEDLEKDVRDQVIRRINRVRNTSSTTYFTFFLDARHINDKKPIIPFFVSPNPDWRKKDLLIDFRMTGDNSLSALIKKEFKKNDSMLLRYGTDKKGSGTLYKKLFFARRYKNWSWIIGTGLYEEEFESIIALNKAKLAHVVRQEIILIIVLIVAISVMAILVARYFGNQIKKEFKSFSTFFQNQVPKNQMLDESQYEINEMRELAASTNRMILNKKAVEDALIESKETAEAATRAKSEFLANMSHEIRTPMNAIMGMSDILAETPLDDEQYEYLEIITTSANNLLVIINDILDFSKIEAGRLNIDRVNFNVRDVIEGVADMISPKAHQKNIELITLIEPEIPFQVLGDSARLHQIILNLANNALKFTEKGEIVISAEIADANESRIKILFKVKDTGIGISDEDQKHLFKTFSQIDTTSTRRYGGTGLGLAISKKLAELMGGAIGVQSREREGSIFWFTCEFEKVAEDISQTTFSSADFKGLKILIVDDNRTNRFILRKYLKVRDCDCDEAGTAWECLEKLKNAAHQSQPYDLVLMDFQMPDVSGIQLAEMIKNEESIKNVPLVLLSSSTAYQTHEELREIGFKALLYKPIKQSQLFRGIASAMGKARAEVKRGKLYAPDLKTEDSEEPPEPLNILLVEDNIFNQKVAAFNLKKFDHLVDLAENGKIAVEKFKSKNYDLILMDVQMPIMDGYEATRLIRQIEKERSHKTGMEFHIPIVAMTANALKEDEEKAYRAGMDIHLAKPFSSDKFISVVHTMANQKNKPSPGD